jgi:hypothetical protein
MPVALDQPLAVVDGHERGHGLAEFVDGAVQLRPQALLLEGADPTLGAPPVSGSPRKAASSAMPSQAIEPRKWAERYCGPQSCRNARPRATSGPRAPQRSITRRRGPAAAPRSDPRPWPRAPTPRRCSGPRRQTPTPTRQPGSRPWSHRCRERRFGTVGMIVPSCGRGRRRPRARCGASSPSWRSSRSTRLPLTWTPCSRRSRARMLR